MPSACPVCDSIFDSDVGFCNVDGAALVEQLAPHTHRTIGGYKVGALIGQGSAGSVYHATTIADGSSVALKLLHTEHAHKRKTVRRFEREAAAIRRMNHPSIVRVIDSGVDDLLYIAMEYLKGPTLQQVITETGSLTPDRAVRVAYQIARGLAEAHRHGFIHRDLKPGNIILEPQLGGEQVKLLDFGLVGFIDDDTPITRVTREGFLLGTAAYMAPEQVGDASALGPEADLYALGIIMYEMLSGAPPFHGSMREVVLQQMGAPPPPLGSYGGLDELVLRLLDKNPRSRPNDASVVAEELKSTLPSLQRTTVALVGDELDLVRVVEPTEPRVEATQPRAEPTRPRVDAPEPFVEPVESPAEPTVPRVDPASMLLEAPLRSVTLPATAPDTSLAAGSGETRQVNVQEAHPSAPQAPSAQQPPSSDQAVGPTLLVAGLVVLISLGGALFAVEVGSEAEPVALLPDPVRTLPAKVSPPPVRVESPPPARVAAPPPSPVPAIATTTIASSASAAAVPAPAPPPEVTPPLVGTSTSADDVAEDASVGQPELAEPGPLNRADARPRSADRRSARRRARRSRTRPQRARRTRLRNELDQLRRRINRDLARRGLDRADLPAFKETRAAAQAWSAAERGGDVDAALASAKQLEPQLNKVKINYGVVDRHMRRLRQALDSSTVPADHGLWKTYLNLAERLDRGLSPGAYQDLLWKTRAARRDLRSLSR